MSRVVRAAVVFAVEAVVACLSVAADVCERVVAKLDARWEASRTNDEVREARRRREARKPS